MSSGERKERGRRGGGANRGIKRGGGRQGARDSKAILTKGKEGGRIVLDCQLVSPSWMEHVPQGATAVKGVVGKPVFPPPPPPPEGFVRSDEVDGC